MGRRKVKTAVERDYPFPSHSRCLALTVDILFNCKNRLLMFNGTFLLPISKSLWKNWLNLDTVVLCFCIGLCVLLLPPATDMNRNFKCFTQAFCLIYLFQMCHFLSLYILGNTHVATCPTFWSSLHSLSFLLLTASIESDCQSQRKNSTGCWHMRYFRFRILDSLINPIGWVVAQTYFLRISEIKTAHQNICWSPVVVK